jgi:hypothetical protein
LAAKGAHNSNGSRVPARRILRMKRCRADADGLTLSEARVSPSRRGRLSSLSLLRLMFRTGGRRRDEKSNRFREFAVPHQIVEVRSFGEKTNYEDEFGLLLTRKSAEIFTPIPCSWGTAALQETSGELSPRPAWRRKQSAANQSGRSNSLVTGKNTGNFADSGRCERCSTHKAPAGWALLTDFAITTNSEFGGA